MRNIFKITSLLLITTIFISCDDKINSLEDLNIEPYSEYYSISNGIWKTNISDNTIKDSVKFYNDNNKIPYSISIRFKDKNKNFGYVNLNSSQFDNQFYVNDVEYFQNFEVKLDSFSFSHKNLYDENRKFTMTISDTWDKKHIINFDLTYFSNKPPVAILNTNVVSNNEYELDASNSYDKDKKYGGFIRTYEFVIDNNFVISTLNKKISHVFNPGTHNIKLRVKDNDLIWSSTVEKTITIN